MIATLKLSMAEDRDIKPYKLQNGINIYSLEEALYLFYNNFKEYGNDFFEQNFIDWIGNELLDEDCKNRLIEIKEQQSFYQKSIEFLTINDFYTLKEIETISLELFNWEKRGQIDRKKLKADKFFKENLFEKAIEIYKDAISFDVSNAILYNNIGVCYIRLREYEKALSYLRKAHNLDKNNDVIVFNIIEALIETEDFLTAIQHIEDINNNIFKRYYYLGELYFKKGKYKEAISVFSNAHILSRDSNVIINISECYVKLNLFEKAEKYLNMVEDIDVDLLIKKGNVFEKINNIPMAIKCIEKANFHNRNNFLLWLKLAKYYRGQNSILKAEGAIAKAYSLSPENQQVLFEQALIKKEQGKFKEYTSIVSKIIQKERENYRKKYNIKG